MLVKDFYNIIDEYAPFELSDKLCKLENMHDNSGIIMDSGEQVKGVLFSLDLTSLAVDRAISEGCNLIITHHPAIYHGIYKIDGALQKACQNKISVISCHLNLDCAKFGVDYYFAEGLGAKKQEILQKLTDNQEGYGRRFFLGQSLGSIRMHAEEVFNTQVICYGYDSMHINNVASFCGAGLGVPETFTECDLLCSADISHHVIMSAIEQGKAVIEFTHFASENYGFKKLYEHFLESDKMDKNIKLIFFDDKRFV